MAGVAAAALVALTLGVEAVFGRLAATAAPAVVVTLAVAFGVAGSVACCAAVLCCGVGALVWGSRDALRAG